MNSTDVTIYDGLDAEALICELRSLLSLSIESILKAAQIVMILDERFPAEPLDKSIPARVVRFLRMIAHGHMLPEVFVDYHGKTQDIVSMLPIEVQSGLVSGNRLDLWSDGEVRAVYVDDLTPGQLKQLFRVSGPKAFIRDIEEQKEYLRIQSVLVLESSRTYRSNVTELPHGFEERLTAVREESATSSSEMIKFYSDRLKSILNAHPKPTLDSEAVLALKMVVFQVGRVVDLDSHDQSSGCITRRIIGYLEASGPTTPASIGNALGVPEAEVLESIRSSRRLFSTNGKEVALVTQRLG